MGGIHSLPAIAATLNHHPDALRIRKLLYGTCYQRWENDPQVLAAIDWVALLTELCQRYPTPAAIAQGLDRTVGALNRKAQYQPLAQVILVTLQSALEAPAVAVPDQTEFNLAPTGFSAAAAPSPAAEVAAVPTPVPATPVVLPTTEARTESTTLSTAHLDGAAVAACAPALDPAIAASVEGLYAQIARSLERQPAALRIRKLIYAVCFQTWENDMLVLESNALVDLLEILHMEYPALAQLSVALNQQAATLNRATVYMQVAHTITEELRSLYESGLPPRAAEPRSETRSGVEAMTLPPPPAPLDVAASVTGMAHSLTEWELPLVEGTGLLKTEVETGLMSDRPPVSDRQVMAAAPLAEPPPRHRNRDNLFDLRLDIMRYANPLQAKLILFSSLWRSFDFSQQDWLALSSQTLDDLLRQLFGTYHNLEEVDINLTRAVYALPHPDDHIPVLNALLRAIAPYYPPS